MSADEVAQLKASIAALEHRLAEVERTRPVVARPAPKMDREVVIQPTPVPAMPAGFPDDGVLATCLNIVRARYPSIAPADDAAFADFKSACLFMAIASRSDGPNVRRYLGDIATRAEDALRARRWPGGNPGRLLLAAAVSTCDVPYLLPNPHAGIIAAVGIADYGGRAPAPKWHDLAAGLVGLLPPWEQEAAPRRAGQPPVLSMREARLV